MLTASINNKYLQLREGSSVRTTWRSPFFSFREFKGDVGLGFTIPNTPVNRALLGNPERFENFASADTRKFEGCVLAWDDATFLSGTLIIQGANDENFDGWIRGNLGNIGDAFREKTIDEIDVFQQPVTFENKADYLPGTDDYCCPAIMNANFFEDFGRKVPDTEMSILKYRHNMGPAYGFVNAKNADGTVKTGYASADIINNLDALDVYVVSPMLFVNYVIEAILKSQKYFIDQNYLLQNNILKNYCLYNNYDITTMQYGGTSGWEIFRWYDDTTYKATGKPFTDITRYSTGFFKYADLLPAASFKDFVISWQNFSNTFMFLKDLNKVDIIDRESILTGPAIDISKYMVGKWELGERKNTTLKFTFEHDDNDAIFSERFSELDDRRDDIKDPVDDWTDLETISSPEFGEIRYINNADVYVEYRFVEKSVRNTETNEEEETEMLGWEHISLSFQNGFYNDGQSDEEEISTKFGRIYSHSRRGPIYQTEHVGNFGSSKFIEKTSNLRIINRNLSDSGIGWDKSNGMIATRWKNTARFLATRLPATARFNFPPNVLDYVRRNLPYKFRTIEGEFIIEELECSISTNRIGLATAKGYKV